MTAAPLTPSPVNAELVTDPATLAAAREVRTAVFTSALGIPMEIDRDALDATADHAVVRLDGRVVATGRLVDRGDGVGVIGRMAVLPTARGTGLGAAVLRRLETRARDRGLAAIELSAQATARDFYARAGYTPTGPEHVEVGLAHVPMRRELLPGLRPVRDADAAAVQALIGGCFAAYDGCVLDLDTLDAWMRAPATRLAATGARLWVLVDVAACVGVRRLDEATAELKSLYVGAPLRRRGLGEALVRFVERQARDGGARQVVLWTDTRFSDAHRLYERLGYARRPETRELHDPSDTVEYCYARDLV